MRTAIVAIVVWASIASARAATEKALSPAPGSGPALIPTTAVLSTDSPLVRAAKLTVRSRLHLDATNVTTIDDSTVGRAPSVFGDSIVGHAARILGEGAPSPSGGATSGGATPSGSTTPGTTNKPAAKATASSPPAPSPVVVSPYGTTFGTTAPSPAPRAPSMQPH